MRSVFLATMMLASAAAALAQSTAPATLAATRAANVPATRPAQRSAEEMLRQMLQPANQGAQPLQPVPHAAAQEDASAGESTVAPRAPAQHLEREGTLLLDRIGRVSRRKDSPWLEFHFEADRRIMSDPPLLLLPNRQLMQLEDLLSYAQADLMIRVISGDISEYRGRNYLMIHRWSQVHDATQPLK